MKAMFIAIIAAPLALAALPAAAQSNPTADQIIKGLTPSGNLVQGGTRGIRLANPDQPAPASKAQPVAAAAPAPRSAPSVSLHVEFATGSTTLTPAAQQTLDRLGKALSSAQLAQYRFRLEGHTDTVGSPETNKTLSQRRAEAVAAYLETKFSLPTARLDSVGLGEEGLAVPTPPQTPNAENRRVTVVNLGS
jgi:OOP family OmpA-OmpF porin